MNRLLFLLVLLSLQGNITYAQKILLLNKPGLTNRIRFQEKTEISFKLAGERIIHTGTITHLTDSMFLLNELYPVKINHIRMVIDYKKRYWVKVLQRITLAAGIMYYGIGTANRLISKDAPPVFEPRFLISSASIIGSSLILKYFSKRRYTINKNTYLKVVDVSIH